MRKRIHFAAYALGVFAALLTCTASAQEYYGVPIGDAGVAFLLDISGSMEGKDEKSGGLRNGLIRAGMDRLRGTAIGRSRVGSAVIARTESELTKMGAARRALMRALGSLRDGTSFTVITFGDDAKQWPGGVRNAGRAATLFAQAYVLNLSATGGTPMAEALSLGFDAQNVGTIFVVSDGKPTTGDVLGLVRQLQEARGSSRMVINTVGIGDDQDAELLCQLATENGGVYVRDDEVACGGSPCPADHSLVTYYPDGPQRHDYPVKTQICSTLKTPKCTPELVYETMISQARFQAPTRDRTKISQCQKLDLRIMDWKPLTRPLDKLLELLDKGVDPITVVLDRESLTATNYTRPGHQFHPGKVTRTVKQDGDAVVVETVGIGTGAQPELNERVGPVIFDVVDEDLAAAVAARLAAQKKAAPR